MSGARARLKAWRSQHPRFATGIGVLLLLLLGGAVYHGSRQWWAKSQLREANLALEQQDWAKAREHLEACSRVWPSDVSIRLLLARASRRLEHLLTADEHLDTCQRLSGSETHAIKVERALLRLHRGDLAGSEPFLRGCLAKNDPDSVEILDVLSASLIINYRVAEARQLLDDLLARQPDHFHALVRRAWTARSAGPAWYAQAVEYQQKALALRPDVDSLRLALAEILVALGRITEARPHFEQLMQRQPNNPSVLFGLARCHAASDQREQARQLFDQVLAANPNDSQALGERGQLALDQERFADAEADLRRAVALVPGEVTLLTRLATCLQQVGKTDEARTVREQADTLKADFARAAKLGEQIHEKSPDDPALRYELGKVLQRLGKQQDALHWYRTAVEKDPRHRATLEALVPLCEQLGHWEQAARYRVLLQQLGSEK